jgi:hypothetical protein
MGAFNRLRAQVACAHCGHEAERAIQFKFGNAWLVDYQIGSSLSWGGNDIGSPGLAKVEVLGAGEECPVCHSDGDDYTLIVENDVITAVLPQAEQALTRDPDGFLVVRR